MKIDLAVLREERKWLTAQRDELLVLGYEKNTKFAELREKIKAGEIEGVAAPVRTRKAAKKKEKPRKPTLAELTAVFASKEEVAAYIEQRKCGASSTSGPCRWRSSGCGTNGTRRIRTRPRS